MDAGADHGDQLLQCGILWKNAVKTRGRVLTRPCLLYISEIIVSGRRAGGSGWCRYRWSDGGAEKIFANTGEMFGKILRMAGKEHSRLVRRRTVTCCFELQIFHTDAALLPICRLR